MHGSSRDTTLISTFFVQSSVLQASPFLNIFQIEMVLLPNSLSTPKLPFLLHCLSCTPVQTFLELTHKSLLSCESSRSKHNRMFSQPTLLHPCKFAWYLQGFMCYISVPQHGSYAISVLVEVSEAEMDRCRTIWIGV